jgi:hypothetical protein
MHRTIEFDTKHLPMQEGGKREIEWRRDMNVGMCACAANFTSKSFLRQISSSRIVPITLKLFEVQAKTAANI